MPTTLQIRRGTETECNAFTGASGELIYDTTNNEIRVHDGVTQGGHKVHLDSAEILALVGNSVSLSTLSNVSSSSPSAGQVLKWNGAAWAPAADDGLITVQEEGSALSTAASTLNFVGSGVTATGSGSTKTITITSPSIPVFGTDYVDSSAVNTLIDTRVNATFINALTIDADTLGGQAGSYYLNYSNFSNTPTIPAFGTDYVDSTAVNTLIGATDIGGLNNVSNTSPSSGQVLKWSGSEWAPAADGGGTVTEAFKTISVAGQSDVVADGATDTLTLVAGSNMTLTTNAAGDTITFASTGGGGGTGDITSVIAGKGLLDGGTTGDVTLNIDSANILTIIDANALDSGRGISLINATVNASFINALTIDADTLGGQAGSYYLNYSNFSNTPTIPSLGNTFVDSAETLKLIDANALDSARAQSLISVPKFGTDYVDSAAARGLLSGGTGITYTAGTGVIDVDVGTSANKIVQLDGSAKLPAVDGSNLTNLPSGGASAFTGLSDTPANFTSSGSKFVKVNSGASALEFVDVTIPTLGGSFVDSAETLKLIDANALDSARGRAFIQGSDLDMGTNKILYANVYSNLVDLPSATDYHGMFAHVHATGKGYFAHGGNWIPLANESSIPTLGGSFVDSAETLKLIDANALDSARAQSLISVPKFGTDYIDSATANTLADARIGAANISALNNVSSTSPSTNQALVWSGSEWAPANQSGGGSGGTATTYANLGARPASGSDGELAYVGGTTKLLYVWDSAAGYWSNVSEHRVFHHIVAGAFSAPITGSKQFSPSSTIYLQSVDATLSAAAASNVKFTLRKSGSTDIDSFTITAGNTTFNSTVSSSAASTITSSDYVTMNIDSGAGNTLAVKVTYLG